jgi:hypothetical protein
MRTLRGPSRSLKSLHQIVSTSDVPFVTRRHTRVGIRCPPDLLSVITLLADGDAELTYESEDPASPCPVRARRAKARERRSSYREPASRNPQAVRWKTCKRSRAPAPVRLLPIRSPRQTELRTSSWLAPSRFTNRSCDLPVEKTRDASNRRMPPNRTTCTRISRVPGSLVQLSLQGRPTESKAPCSMTGGPDVFTTSEDRFGGSHRARSPMPASADPGRGLVRPTASLRSNL